MTEGKLRDLIIRYVHSLDARRVSMQEAVDHFVSLAEKGKDIRRDRYFADFRRDSHQLAGSAGSMGFAALGRAAMALEVMINALVERQSSPSVRDIRQMRALFERVVLRMEATNAEDSTLFALSHDGTEDAPSGQPRIIALVSSALGEFTRLAQELHPFGLELSLCSNRDCFMMLLQDNQLRAVLIDRHSTVSGLSADQVRALCPPSVSLVILSDKIDLRCRVDAWHNGAGSVIDISSGGAEVVDAIEHAAGPIGYAVPRVLIVDDDEAILAVCEHVLSEVGISCETLPHAENILDVISVFRPDLLVIDRHMPDFSGLEVAAAIRQQPAYTNLPLIFLTRDDNLESRIDAIRAGGDGYVTKPVDMEYLIALVRQRILRSRQLQGMISRDGLTGLLNHAAFYKRLEVEIAQAHRSGNPLSVMLLDLDYFKKVNDTWGHPAGDAVLQSLARLLRQRLRSGDLCGRLGGEEFAILLTGTKGSDALRVGGELLDAFRDITHHSGSETFTLTFSAGVAELTAGIAADQLLASADRALYAAKRGGRAQVYRDVDISPD
ncbi:MULTISPECIES: diguanylate cyclase domain-containing protein [unclassified Haematospirillum]|uniref:diguanylate cyclase domain-containing protein n=1 Tax=unclassified Haematospirillum TaxID=2622088 RepID=UPI001439A9DE|nr:MULTISPECIES: diguanylate cyclase [unclassified Haematospirillum]NKD54059.1 diguanylate cyclase [Haematospirillum sp. H4890]NKD74104.1 diguanylate cyclase [Haematospirillum sp. H4485]NKD87226.1 diguanylate cyclase [Haematospirillum sp. 15-248]